MPKTGYSGVAVLGAMIALAFIALAGVVIIQPGPEATQRLGLLFGVIGAGVAAVVGLLKADQAATQTNGALDDRIQAAVGEALAARRRNDPAIIGEASRGAEAAANRADAP